MGADTTTGGRQRTGAVADKSISLDGFVAGPNDSVDQPLGDGIRLFDGHDADGTGL